ncbi:MAG: hypothetical protein GY882_00195 [Actinomycetia bacterium]|nr:hypothetical protein [Actinomycetes bacterium]
MAGATVVVTGTVVVVVVAGATVVVVTGTVVVVVEAGATVVVTGTVAGTVVGTVEVVGKDSDRTSRSTTTEVVATGTVVVVGWAVVSMPAPESQQPDNVRLMPMKAATRR